LFEINFWGVVRMTRAFLPLLQKSDDARLVNISSVYGLISPPGQVRRARIFPEILFCRSLERVAKAVDSSPE
jgi:NAD(P)-dependent dehydrogenase (short-subunit alcohol dehydrogenase family)